MDNVIQFPVQYSDEEMEPMTKEELLDALEHPEQHESLVVRIGGFSEYFNRLSPTLKQSVIDRAEY